LGKPARADTDRRADAQTRDIIQDIYIRRVERMDGELFNVEFDKYEAVRDPHKAAQSK
jgi:branched-chain amino acid transport system substrate-binding protein